MLRLSFIALFFTALSFNSKAQVKIGDNPNSINANSILELETTNKGFLPPRVSLNSVSSPSPLVAPVPAGMLVYSSGGALVNGFYMWNGSLWQNLGTSGSTRNNMVLVKSMADFPAPVGGVITLSAGTLYEINGAITVSASINLNGCNVRGADPVNDKLVYTGAGELFTGNGAGGLRLLTLTAASGKVFNINGGGVATKNLLIQNCYFMGCNEVGTIQNIGGTVYMNSVAYFYNQNGITFQSCANVVVNNSLWDISNSNVYEKFSGTFNIIQILGGDRLVASGATALHVSGITSLIEGSVKVVMFTGSGTYVSGSFSKEWEVESSGLNTEKDDVSAGNMYLSSVSITSFNSSNTPVKVNANTNSASLFRMSSTSNRLTYTGTKNKRFQVICSLTGTPSNNNTVYSFYVAKNGVILPESRQAVKMTNTTDQQSVTMSCTVPLATNDYIEIWVSNDSNTGLLIVSTLNLAAQ